jgi:transcriptional regulator with XRE-family HTH domain
MGQQPRSLDPSSSSRAFFGSRLRDWRLRRGFSQVHLGKLVHTSGALIARIEKAERRAFPELIDRLDTVLEAEGDLSRLKGTLRADDREAVPVAPTELTPMRPAQSAAHLEAVSGVGDVLAGLRRVDHSLGSGAMLATVLAQVQVAEQLLSSAASGRPHQQALALLGEVHQLAGWMQFDRGEWAAAETSLAMARQLAEAADDPALVAYILGPNQGFSTTVSGHPALGRERCELALQWARRSGNQRLTAFVLAVGARAEARLGDERRCLEMLDAADGELAGHDESSPDPVWLSVFDEAALRGHRGSCLADLGSPGNAIDSLRQQEASAPGLFVRNRAIWLLDRADAHLAMNDLEAACDGIEQAWETAAGTSSRRILRRLTAAVSSLDRWGAVSVVADLRERIQVPAPM